MAADNTVLSIREYGLIELRVKAIMDERGINRNMLARRINTRFEVVDKWYNGNVEKIDLDVLARMCFVLECEVSDIMVYKHLD